MPQQYDAVVIGAGHNGLTAACYLASAGLKVIVLEQYHTIGGMTITEEITLPGFRSDIYASGYQFANFSPVPQELQLDKFGLALMTPDVAFSHAFPNGKNISVHRRIEKTIQNIAQYSLHDAEAWRKLSVRYRSERNQIISSFFSPPTSFSTKIPSPMQMPRGIDNYSFNLQSLRSWVNETFEAEETKCLFGAFATCLGAAPDDAGGAELAWLFASVLQHEGNNFVTGGMHHVSLALAEYLKSNGGTIRTNAKVDKIIGTKQRATSVRLADGEEILVGHIVVSSVDPAELILQLLGQEMISTKIIDKMEHYEWGDSIFTMYVALDSPVHYKAGKEAEMSAQVHLSAPSLTALAQTAVDCRGGKLPADPLIVSWNDSAIDPSRAPQGKQLMKFVAHHVPYQIKGEKTGKISEFQWDEVRDRYADYLIDKINENYIPDLKEKILQKVAYSPLDIQRKITSAVNGTLNHGAFLPYQMGAMRPIPELGEYRTPISNVYLCGAGSHPGLGVSMGPGRNAVQIICKDLHIDFKSLVERATEVA